MREDWHYPVLLHPLVQEASQKSEFNFQDAEWLLAW